MPPQHHESTERDREWLTRPNMPYHLRQFEAPYRSTVKFLELLRAQSIDECRVFWDIACGGGANSMWLAKMLEQDGRFGSDTRVVGVDINTDLLELARRTVPPSPISLDFQHGDLFDLQALIDTGAPKPDCAVILQTLSWLSDVEPAVQSICRTGARMICGSSLFYDGLVTCRIHVTEYADAASGEPTASSPYNIYSIPIMREQFARLGYDAHFVPYEIDVDLPQPADRCMGTYTEQVSGNRRLQLSGPLLLSWYFFFAIRHA